MNLCLIEMMGTIVFLDSLLFGSGHPPINRGVGEPLSNKDTS